MHCLTWTLFIRKHVLFVIRLSVFRPSVNTALVTCDIFIETYGNPNARAIVCFKRGRVTKRFEITGFQIKRSLFQSLNPASSLVLGRPWSSPSANPVTRQLVSSYHHLGFYQVKAKLEIFVCSFIVPSMSTALFSEYQPTRDVLHDQVVQSPIKLTQISDNVYLSLIFFRWVFLLILFVLQFWAWVIWNYTKHKQCKKFLNMKNRYLR